MKTIRTHHPREHIRAWRNDLRRILSLSYLRTTAESAGGRPEKAENAGTDEILHEARQVLAGHSGSPGMPSDNLTNGFKQISLSTPSRMPEAKRLSTTPPPASKVSADAQPPPPSSPRVAVSKPPLPVSQIEKDKPQSAKDHAPPDELVPRLVAIADMFVRYRLLATYGHLIDASADPEHFPNWTFEAMGWPLHPTLSLDEIADVIEHERVRLLPASITYYIPPIECLYPKAVRFGLLSLTQV
jgi:hypothetical protein